MRPGTPCSSPCGAKAAQLSADTEQQEPWVQRPPNHQEAIIPRQLRKGLGLRPGPTNSFSLDFSYSKWPRCQGKGVRNSLFFFPKYLPVARRHAGAEAFTDSPPTAAPRSRSRHPCQRCAVPQRVNQRWQLPQLKEEGASMYTRVFPLLLPTSLRANKG